MVQKNEQNKDKTISRRLSMDEIKRRFKDRKENIEYIAFNKYLRKKIDEKELLGIDILKKSNMNKNTYYAILRGERKPSRNKVIQLAIGMSFTIDEVNSLLWRAGFSNLDNLSNNRDAIILICIENGHSIDDIDELLFEFDEELLVSE